jgi:hypothetical protein
MASEHADKKSMDEIDVVRDHIEMAVDGVLDNWASGELGVPGWAELTDEQCREVVEAAARAAEGEIRRICITKLPTPARRVT